MPTSLPDLLDELERRTRQHSPEAALRGLKALSSAADDRDATRRVRHAAIELLGQLADLRDDRTSRSRSPQDIAKSLLDICEAALSVVGDVRLLIRDDVFSDASIASGYSALEAYVRRSEESARQIQRGVFISYRRIDTIDTAGRIYDRLRAAFGDDQVFMDVESMPPGINFRAHVVSRISACCACLVLIGNDWLTSVDRSGRRRLDSEDDPVRVEIETALRIQVPTIPILINGTPMPSVEELPSSISALHYNHALPVRPSPDFDHDVTRLLGSLQNVMSYSSLER